MGTNLLKKYDKSKHLKNINLKDSFEFDYMYSETWKEESNIPYVLKTHLVDSYYCLPERPDMAYTFLWKCINNTYSTYQRRTSSEVLTGDAKLLENILTGISNKLCETIEWNKNTHTIKNLIEMYIEKVPDKLLKFISNYILKSYVIEQRLQDDRYIYSSFTTFKKRFKEIYDVIIETYGKEYLKICSPIIENGEVYLNITDEEKSRGIIHSLSQKIKQLVINKEVNITHDSNEYLLQIKTDEKYIQFIVFNILYAIRNNTVHGKIASRLNSIYVNSNSFQASTYTFLLGYMFLSLMLYVSDELKLEDLTFNFENIKYL